MWEHSILCKPGHISAGRSSSALPTPWKFWRQENKRYYSATGGPAGSPPPYRPQSSTPPLLDNKYQIITTTLHRSPSPTFCPSTCWGTIIKYLEGRLVSQWSRSILLNYILHSYGHLQKTGQLYTSLGRSVEWYGQLYFQSLYFV